MKELAAAFDIDPTTVSRRLRQAGIAVRRSGPADEQVVEAVHHYQEGWSSGRLAANSA
jgi:DNA-binding MarR family transcriptional regulator